MKVAAIVPSLNPNEYFPKVIDGLVEAGFERIYIVNDGSESQYLPLFEEAATKPGCVVLTHSENKGKGRGLKTAIERYLDEADDYVGVVTLDGDGQHQTEDVVAVAKVLEENPDKLVLGCRDFGSEEVPKKSELGNKITRTVFRMACGLSLTDTQTGLRGIPNDFARFLLNVRGERYEFETNMLLETKRFHIGVIEVPIHTIYIDNNSASHFRPFLDSFRIYALILKFTFSSLASSLADLGLFTLLNWMLAAMPGSQRLLIATVVARIFSALINFFVNKQLVFASNAKTGGAMLRYAILAALQMLCSYGGTYLLSEVLPIPALPAKIVVDVILFFISFQIQRSWVFKSDR